MIQDGLKQSLNTIIKKKNKTKKHWPLPSALAGHRYGYDRAALLLQGSIALPGSAAQEAHREFQVTAKFQACAGQAAKFCQPPLMGASPPAK